MTKYTVTEAQETQLKALAHQAAVVHRRKMSHDEARKNLNHLILTARDEGISVNRIAKAVGLTTTRIGQIEKDEKEKINVGSAWT